MGITLQGLGAAASGAVEGFQGQREDNRAQQEANRKQTEFDRNTTTGEQLGQRTQAFEEVFQIANASREEFDKRWSSGAGISELAQAGNFGTPPPGAAPPPAIPAAPVAPPQIVGGVGAAPVVAPPPAGWTGYPPTPGQPPGFAHGGVAQVPDEGVIPPGVAPVAPVAPAAPPQAAPVGPPQPAPVVGPPVPEAVPPPPAYKTRRDEYQDWYKKTSAAVAMSGGLEGLKMFRDHEDALSRKQMFGYGMDGVTAMRDGNTGEAVRQLNTMLNVSPADPGMRFEAYDGKVHLVGKDNKRGKPYNQQQVMALIENNLKTPENYLAFQEQALADRKQAEVERAGPVGEATAQQRAEAATSQAETYAGALALDKEHRGEETAAKTANALAALIKAKSARDSAAALLSQGSNWTAAQTLKIYADADSWSQDHAMIPKEMGKAMKEDEFEWGKYKSDIMNQMTNNTFGEGPNREQASAVSLLIRNPGDTNLSEQLNEEGKFKDLFMEQRADGTVMVNYDGFEWKLPYNLALIASQSGMLDSAEEPPPDATKDAEEKGAEGGGKEQAGVIDTGPDYDPLAKFTEANTAPTWEEVKAGVGDIFKAVSDRNELLKDRRLKDEAVKTWAAVSSGAPPLQSEAWKILKAAQTPEGKEAAIKAYRLVRDMLEPEVQALLDRSFG